MLYYLLYETLFPIISPFRVFGYITFRTAYASLTALLLCLILGPWLIRKLREFQIGQVIRAEGPESHRAKEGTPTMGGLLINISILVPTLLWADLRNTYVWIAMFSLAAFGLVGFWDDYQKVTRRQNLGLTARRKIALQIAISLALGAVLVLLHSRGMYSTKMNVPFLKFFAPDLLIAPLLAGSGIARWPLFEGKVERDGAPTAYVCRGYACDEPTSDPERVAAQVIAASPAGPRT